MTKRDKRIQKFLNRKGSVDFLEAKAVLYDLGFIIDRVQGSHFIFIDENNGHISIPFHRKEIKVVYVKMIQKIINQKLQ